jgi:plastocyanin
VALSRRNAAALTVACAVVALLVLAGSAFGADQRVVKAEDDCDPVTFTQAGVPCIGDGRTPIGDLVAAAQADNPPPTWRFTRTDFNIDAGGTITFVNEGGEAHTFTEVPAFGDGCIPVVNPGGVIDNPAVPDCATFDPATDPRVVRPGGTETVPNLQAGTVLFQCIIHPWMRSTVEVRAKGRRG